MPLKRFLCILLTAAVTGLCVGVDVSSADKHSDFSVVVLPDTQFYSQLHPDTYVCQTQWIKDRVEADNIKCWSTTKASPTAAMVG